ncbi:MAG: PCMD domain-containing protein [Bacteroidales bacterium]|nr:PCMD domain-containing protein [Bacteroidales bacterium]
MKALRIVIPILFAAAPLYAQRVELVPFGDFEQWSTRSIKESAILGGETKTLYTLGSDHSRTPWASSNVYAKVSGVTKTSLSVEPDNGPSGRCAKLSTVMASCRVAGLVDIEVLATGSLFWGKLFEPITGVRNPYANMDWGIPFTGRPEAFLLDYKAFLPATGKILKGTTLRKTEIPGEDPCQVMLILQRRWEDADGNIHAERVGTAFLRIGATTQGWVKDSRVQVIYGDARKNPGYKAYMGLITGEKTLYAVNSRGKRVPVREEGWADPETRCTHAVLHISSGCQGGFTGAPGNTLWVDNLRIEYPEQ